MIPDPNKDIRMLNYGSNPWAHRERSFIKSIIHMRVHWDQTAAPATLKTAQNQKDLSVRPLRRIIMMPLRSHRVFRLEPVASQPPCAFQFLRSRGVPSVSEASRPLCGSLDVPLVVKGVWKHDRTIALRYWSRVPCMACKCHCILAPTTVLTLTMLL